MTDPEQEVATADITPRSVTSFSMHELWSHRVFVEEILKSLQLVRAVGGSSYSFEGFDGKVYTATPANVDGMDALIRSQYKSLYDHTADADPAEYAGTMYDLDHSER